MFGNKGTGKSAFAGNIVVQSITVDMLKARIERGLILSRKHFGEDLVWENRIRNLAVCLSEHNFDEVILLSRPKLIGLYERMSKKLPLDGPTDNFILLGVKKDEGSAEG